MTYVGKSTTLILVLLLLVVASAALVQAKPVFTPQAAGVKFFAKAFTPDEAHAIIKQMRTLPVEVDERIDKSVNRTNYFDKGTNVTSPDSAYGWIFERIRALYTPDESMESFVSRINFVLLHEFEESGFFDWHVDTKPGDKTGREDNINVMLSDRGEYEGGGLAVGGSDVMANQGDCYTYPAAFPHKVGDITGGRRHTFIIAMTCSKTTSDAERQVYWDRAEHNYRQLCTAISTEPKLHMLHGEFLAALGRPDSEVDAKFADMYASTAEAENYANSFEEQGQQLVQMRRMDEGKGYLTMAEMIRTRIANCEAAP